MGLRKMNKLILGEKKEVNQGTYEVTNLIDSLTIKEDVKLYAFNQVSNEYFNLDKKSNLYYEKIDYLDKDIELNFILDNNSTLDMRYLIVNQGDNKVTLNIKCLGNNNHINLSIRVINKEASKINLEINGHILANTYDNVLIEDAKGLTNGQDVIKICPNIYADTSEVEANHLVTVGSYNPEELFYLMSKGINKEEAQKLLLKSFVKSIFNYYKDREVINFE